MTDRPTIVDRAPVRGGFTPAERWRARLADGRRVFVKRAVDADTAGWLRTEIAVYRALAGASFLAELVHADDGDVPELWLEDLSDGHWPRPWRPGDVPRVLAALDTIHDTVPPSFVTTRADPRPGWAELAASPEAFLGLGWATERWLAAALPTLIAAERLPTGPDVLLHQDTRSDNLCLLPDRVVVVDWNWVSVGPRELDRAFWAPSLEAEGGGRAEDLVTASEPWAAAISGFFAWRAGLPELPHAPRVRWIQRIQLGPALSWAVRTYGLPDPDGPGWPRRDRLV